jgi:hypothetical protein
MVSATSALSGHGEIAYGNAIGSIICNTALIAALTVTIRPSTVQRKALLLPVAFFFVAAGIYSFAAYGMGTFSRGIGLILLFFVNRKGESRPYMVVLNCENHDAEVKAKEFLAQNVIRSTVKSKSAVKGAIEMNIEVRLKEDDTDFIGILSEMPGVNSAVIVSYNGDYMG